MSEEKKLSFYESYEAFELEVISVYKITKEQSKELYNYLIEQQNDDTPFTLKSLNDLIDVTIKEKYQSEESTEETTETETKVETETETETEVEPVKEPVKIPPLEQKHSFEWVLPEELDPEKYMLIKGVGATEGTFKSSDIFTKENLIYATGAMSMAAFYDQSVINVDHYHEDLPEKYHKKYGLKEGIVGGIIDAATSVNHVVDSDGKSKDLTQLEWYGYTTDPVFYQMVKDGKGIGCSVEDMARKAVCQCTDTDCSCTIEGSHFINMAIIIDEVPDSHGTWVNVVTKEDVESWKGDSLEIEFMKKLYKKNPNKAKKLDYMTNHIKTHAQRKNFDLDDYMEEDGSFTDGKDGIIKYLMEDVGLADYDAKDIAEYLYTHPKSLNVVQMAYMSIADWVSWFRHIQTVKLELSEKRNNHLMKLVTIKHLTKLAKDDEMVNYRPLEVEEDRCERCRWFDEGKCAIITEEGEPTPGAIDPQYTCDFYWVDPAIDQGEEEAEQEEEEETEEETEEEEQEEEATEDSKKEPIIIAPYKHNKRKNRTTLITDKPVKSLEQKKTAIQKRADEILLELKEIGTIMGGDAKALEKQGKYMALKNELDELGNGDLSTYAHSKERLDKLKKK